MAVDVRQIEWRLGARDQASQVFKSIGGAMGALKSSYLAIGSALAGGAIFTKFLSDAIATRSALDDLSDTTGDSVLTLDGLRRVALVSGMGLEQLGGSLSKLAKNMNSADDDGKAAGEAIKAIGLDIEALRAKKPGEAFFEIALALDKYQDGASKVAVAQALMSRGGSAMLPVLKDLAEEGRLNGRITGEQAQAAEALEKSYRRLTLAYADSKDTLATELIPWLTKMVEQMKEGIRIAGGFGSALRLFGLSNIRGDNAGEKIRDITAAIEEYRQANVNLSKLTGYEAAIAANNAHIADLEKQKQFAQLLQRQIALEGAGGDTAGERARMGGARAQLDFKIPEKNKAATQEKISAFETLKRQLDEQLAKTGDLNKAEELLRLLQTERYKEITPAQQQILLGIAKQIDLEREMAAALKQDEEAKRKWREDIDRDRQKEKERIEDLRKKYADLADPLDVYRRELNEIVELWERGYLADEVAEKATAAITEKMYPALEKTVNIAHELGLTFSSAFEDAVAGGKSFRDILSGIEKDLLRLGTRKLVTEPMMGWFDQTLKSGGGISGAGASILKMIGLGGGGATQYSDLVTSNPILGTALSLDSFDTGTDYVPRTGLYTLHQGEKVVTAKDNKSRPITVTNVFNISGATDKRSQLQIAAAAQEGLNRGARNL